MTCTPARPPFKRACRGGWAALLPLVAAAILLFALPAAHAQETDSTLRRASLAAFRTACALNQLPACHALGALLAEPERSAAEQAEALQIFEKACADAYYPSCHRLGHINFYGIGVPVDLDRANELFGRGCAAGNAAGCSALGVSLAQSDPAAALGYAMQGCDMADADGCAQASFLLINGDAEDRQNPDLVRTAQFACDNDQPSGCYNLALALLNGWGIAVDAERARHLLETACAGEIAAACNDAGLLHETLPAPDSLDVAFTLFRDGCILGDPASCFSAGYAYFNGRGTQTDLVAARVAYQGACEGDVFRACAALAIMLRDGLGTDADPVASVALLERACNDTDPDHIGCYELAHAYRIGAGVVPDIVRAASYYALACELGNAGGCAELGDLYFDGQGVAQSYQRSAEFYTLGCDGNDAWACAALGDQFENGVGIEQDYTRAAELAAIGCADDIAFSCASLGTMYQWGRGGHDIDPTAAAGFYERACQAGNARGCTNLAYMLNNGLGVETDFLRAFDLNSFGCDKDNFSACQNLGWQFEHGHGVPADPGQALVHYERACEGGNAVGCENAGRLYGDKDSDAPDLPRANALFEKSCAAGQASACTRLGYNYSRGIGIDEDDVAAVHFYRLACDGDHPRGCNNLGSQHKAGAGVEQSWSEAYRYFQRACDFGYDRACPRAEDALTHLPDK